MKKTLLVNLAVACLAPTCFAEQVVYTTSNGTGVSGGASGSAGYVDADAQISRALTLQGDFEPALELRLRRELVLHDQPGAEQTTQELAKLPDKRRWSLYARMLFAERKYDEGAAEYERVLKEHGDDPGIRDEYAAMMMAAGRLKLAEAIIASTLAKAPKDGGALLQRATIEIAARNTDGAAKDIKTLLDMKALSPALSYQQSRLAAARGDMVAQGSLLADVLRQNPRLFRARLDLAELLYSTGKGRDALSILEQADAGEKSTAEYLFHHNMALMASGDWEQARKGVDAGLARAQSPGFLYQDGRLRAKSRDLPGARKCYLCSRLNLVTDKLTATRQFSCFPNGPQYWRVTPTDSFPFLGKPVSSTIHAITGSRFLMAARA